MRAPRPSRALVGSGGEPRSAEAGDSTRTGFRRPSARRPLSASGTFDFGCFRLDTGKRVVWRAGELVPLPPKALDLLIALVEQNGDVVAKPDLMARVWPDTVVEEANLSVNVSMLRRMLGRQDDGRHYIETVPRRGYRFVAAARRVAATGPLSLAVLPFRPIGPQGDLEWLGLGLADAVITRLGGTGEVSVRPTGTIAGARANDPVEAARVLKVDAVLAGTLQVHAGRLRVHAQLVDAAGAPLWTDRMDADFADVLAAEDAVADRLAEAITNALGVPPRRDVEPRLQLPARPRVRLRRRLARPRWTPGLRVARPPGLPATGSADHALRPRRLRSRGGRPA